MTSPSSADDLYNLTPKDRERFGYARALDVCYDAILTLWDRRKTEGMKQADLASAIGKDVGWISRKLQGPANLTFRTFGALVEAMDGEIEIKIIPKGATDKPNQNWSVYSQYCIDLEQNSAVAVSSQPQNAYNVVGS